MNTAFLAAVRVGMAALSLPLMFAIQGLIDQRIGVATTNQRLLHAAGDGRVKEVCRALADGASVDSRDEVGCTALLYAAAAGNNELVALLIERGADVNAGTPLGITPLMMAACLNRGPVAELLLNHGADPSRRTVPGNVTAFDCAVDSEAFAAAEVIKRHESLQK